MIDKSVPEIRVPFISERKSIDPVTPAASNDMASVVVLVVSWGGNHCSVSES